MEKPLLFLDVDVVLNSLALHTTQEPVVLDGIHVWIPEGSKERLMKLDDHFEILWCTAWFQHAHAFKCHFGIAADREWPVVNWNHLKIHEITETIGRAGDPRWAWVDDDAHWELDQLHGNEKSAIAEDISTNRAMIVNCDPNVGLTDNEVECLVEFARKGNG